MCHPLTDENFNYVISNVYIFHTHDVVLKKILTCQSCELGMWIYMFVRWLFNSNIPLLFYFVGLLPVSNIK